MRHHKNGLSTLRSDPDVLDLGQAASFIRVSEDRLRHMARSKRIPYLQIGREWCFRRHSLKEWLASHDTLQSRPESVSIFSQRSLFEDSTPSEKHREQQPFSDTAFPKNRIEPLHRWVPWIAGFSASFVEEALERAQFKDPSGAIILDPFAGVGTTLLEGMKRGCDVIGFEINPYAALVCKAKLSAAELRLSKLRAVIQDLEHLHDIVETKANCPSSRPPANFTTRSRFLSLAVEREVLLLQDFINGIEGGVIRDLLRVALGSILVAVSNYSYEPSLCRRSSVGKENILHADVINMFKSKLQQMELDILFLQRHMRQLGHLPSARLHTSSYLAAADVLPPHCVDMLITSPPYLNNYHYVRNTRPHLHWLSLVEDNNDLKRIEEESFGKFWQSVRASAPMGLSFDLPELSALLDTIRQRNSEKGVYGGSGWANYAATYFNDCETFFSITRRLMKPGGRAAIVIGNSILQGVHVETDRYMAKIAGLHGFAVEGNHRVRKKRTGSSIIGSSVREGAEKGQVNLYETVIELTAPNNH